MRWVNGTDLMCLCLTPPPNIVHFPWGISALPLWPLQDTAQGTTLSWPVGLWLLRSASGESPLTAYLK